MKKILSLIICLIVCFTMVFSSGCKKKKQESTPVPIVERLEIDESNVLLALGQTKELQVSYNEIPGQTIAWSSSNPNVVSVDGKGKVDAMGEGFATVTAKYGTKQVSCQFEVSLLGNVPTLVFGENISQEITLLKGSKIDLGTRVRFNGSLFSDGKIEYYLTDSSIGSVENGEFVSKDKTGSTIISVFATWRGQTVRSETLTVNVISEKTVLLNGGRLTSIEVFMVGEHEGERYSTSQTISSMMVTEDGKPITDYEVSILDGAVASIEKNSSGWVVTGNKAGNTKLVVSFGDNEFYVDVAVKRPVARFSEKVEFSLSDNMYLDSETATLKTIDELIDGFSNVIAYAYDGKENKVRDGILNLPEGLDKEVILYSDTVGYSVNFDVYSMILDELSDFVKIYAGDTSTIVNGYYMLAKDIIEPDTVLEFPSGKVPNDFGGIFDGKGHVLTFTFKRDTNHRYGLFGAYLHGATIKNLALHNVKQNASSGREPAGILCGEAARATGEPISVIENVYVNLSFTDSYEQNLVFMGNAMWALEMKNVIIFAPEVPEANTYGSFARGQASTVNNCYVISSAPLYKTNEETKYTMNIPTLFESYESFYKGGLDFSAFSSDYWNVDAYGVPVWKSLVSDLAGEFEFLNKTEE